MGCLLRVQRKKLTSCFWNLTRHFPEVELTFFTRIVRTGFHLISDTCWKKNWRKLGLKFLLSFTKYFSAGLPKSLYTCPEALFGSFFFSQKTYTTKYEILTLFWNKSSSLNTKIPSGMLRLHLMITVKHFGKNLFRKEPICLRKCFEIRGGI